MTKENMTYDEFVHKIYQIHKSQPNKDDLRLGQIYFNELAIVRPEIAEAIRGSMLDPFYKERITNVVSEFVRERW